MAEKPLLTCYVLDSLGRPPTSSRSVMPGWERSSSFLAMIVGTFGLLLTTVSLGTSSVWYALRPTLARPHSRICHAFLGVIALVSHDCSSATDTSWHPQCEFHVQSNARVTGDDDRPERSCAAAQRDRARPKRRRSALTADACEQQSAVAVRGASRPWLAVR